MVGPEEIEDLLSKHEPCDSFYIFDLGQVDRAYSEWTRTFPTIRPFYAVKCNPNKRILKTLAHLGSSFDCASPAEIASVLKIGVDPSRIIYANPCKKPRDISWAYANGVKRTTFDSVCELAKIAECAPEMEAVLRIRADDPSAQCALGNKYGAEEQDLETLAAEAARLGVKVIGVSFHVGSGSRDPNAHSEAIKKSKKTFELLFLHGHRPYLLDIGGGFTSSISQCSEKINKTIIELFPEAEVIAEPGRYIAEQVGTLVTPVIGVKNDSVTIDESLYGAFNCMIFDHSFPDPIVFSQKQKTQKTLFGCTCDGMDIIYKDVFLPDLSVGEWIAWPGMGAYTIAATTGFNGMPFNKRKIYYI